MIVFGGLARARAIPAPVGADVRAVSKRCSLYASPRGSDRAAGTLARPFASVQRLVDTLRPGQVGCLRGGIFPGDITVARSGTRGRPLTITTYPGEHTRVIGRLLVSAGAAHLVFASLGLDGRNARRLPSPTVFGSDVTFVGDNVTNWHTSICFDLGQTGGTTARGIKIERSVIHDCGQRPAGNHEHGIYVENTRDVLIAWNLIFNNADRGIQLYPDAQRTTIEHNVIYGNGEGVLFAGDANSDSTGALVTHNVIAGSDVRSNVESWYPAGAPAAGENLLTDNCIGSSRQTAIDTSGGGFEPTANLIAEPKFVDVTARNFTLLSSSPCLPLSGEVATVVASALLTR